MFRNILVTLDGTEPSNNALKHASSVAALSGARLILTHVLLRGAPVAALSDLAAANGFADKVKDDLDDVEVLPVAAMGAAGVVETVSDDLLEKFAFLLLDKAASAAHAQGVAETESRQLDDDPATAILDCAKSENLDLIVTGSRGFGDVKSLLLGSVFHKLVENAECPFVVVK